MKRLLLPRSNDGAFVRVLVLIGLCFTAFARAGEVGAEDSLDFTGQLGAVGPGNQVRDPGYYVWCSAGIRGEDGKFYLFYARWPVGSTGRAAGDEELFKDMKGWLKYSEIAAAVSDSPTGPFRHIGVILRGRADTNYWDCFTAHNAHVKRFERKVYLYYTSTRPVANADRWTQYTDGQRLGVVVANSVKELVAGQFRRSARPLISPDGTNTFRRAVNPSVTQGRDGRYYLMFKAVSTPVGGHATHWVAVADKPDGPFHLAGPVFTEAKYAAEDPYFWYDRERDRYYAILKDFSRKERALSPQFGALALVTSEKGFDDWRPARHNLVSLREFTDTEGHKHALKHLERPQLLFDPDGNPICLYAAAAEKDPFKGTPSFSLAIPIRSRGFSTVGIYIGPPKSNDVVTLPFLKTCGYNYLEFCETGFAKRPDQLPEYYAQLNAAIGRAQQEGFRVWILLLAGMRQWHGPATTGSAGTFSALNQEALRERLQFIEQAVKGLPAADGLEFFAGDPGGDPEGRSTIQDCLSFARSVQNIVQHESPRAGFAVNLWAVAEWAGFPSPFTVDFWRKQVQLSRAVAEDKRMLGPKCGVVFSLDNYYRSLTLMCYAENGASPELFPQAGDVAALRRKGVGHVLGWPYFLVDEVDDGFITPNNVASRGQAGAETRYIRAVIDRGRGIGLDGLVANAAFRAAEALNIYAFGRMCRVRELTPEAALDAWAGVMANDAAKADLGQVLRFIENHSNWENSLPPAYRLPPLKCELTSATNAIERLSHVVARTNSTMPLLEPPKAYLGRLKRRLDDIAAGKIGDFHPVVKDGATKVK